MAFEYKIASAEEPTDAHVVQSLLDAYGKDGWDLAFVTQSSAQLRLFFRKEVEEALPEVEPISQPTILRQLKPLTQRLVNVAELEKLRGQQNS